MLLVLVIISTSPVDYTGTDWERVQQASIDAAMSDQFVELDRVYTIDRQVALFAGVTYTGGGLKRQCGSLANLATAFHTGDPYQHGIVVDGVEFDGSAECTVCESWRCAVSLSIRGRNTVRNSWFHDTPGENIWTCGATISSNIATDLAGSFAHISCTESASYELETITGNIVVRAGKNAEELGHVEGVVTLSAHSRWVVLTGNRFLMTSLPSVGHIGADDGPVVEVP